jgi:hypothetical protein
MHWGSAVGALLWVVRCSDGASPLPLAGQWGGRLENHLRFVILINRISLEVASMPSRTSSPVSVRGCSTT